MQQEGAAVILGAVAGVRHHDEIRLQIHDRLQRGEPAEGDAKFTGCVEQSGLGQQRTQQALAAGHPAAPRQRQHPVALVRDRLARARDRGIEPGDFRRRAIRMLHDRAHLADLVLDLVERARNAELGEVKTFLLQKLARRALVEQARDHDIRPEHKYVLGAARQDADIGAHRLPPRTEAGRAHSG